LCAPIGPPVDGLRDFDADEVIVVTRSRERGTWD
jgi:hypothetical protein